jgi:O-acetylserine/cysteine efflux transporter
VPLKDKLIAILCVVFWGGTHVALKYGLDGFSPFLLNFVRFTLVFLAFLPFCDRLDKNNFSGILKYAVVQGIFFFAFLTVALKNIDASISIVVLQIDIPFALLLSAMLFNEKVGVYRWSGMMLSFVGVILLAGKMSKPELIPLLMVVVVAMAGAYTTIIVKTMQNVRKITIMGWSSLFIALMMLGLSLKFENNQIEQIATASWQAWAGLLFVTFISSCGAFTLWYVLISRNELSKVLPFGLLVPVTGFLSGVLILGESVTPNKLIGSIVVVGGVALIEMREYFKKKNISKKAIILKEQS